MKKMIYTIFILFIILEVKSQDFDINMKVDTIETYKRNTQSGKYDLILKESVNSSVYITDSVVIVKNKLNQETKYRVFEGQGSVFEHTENNPNGEIIYNVINDKTGEFFKIQYIVMEFGITSFLMINDTKQIVFIGKK